MGLFSRSLKGNKEDFSHLQGRQPSQDQGQAAAGPPPPGYGYGAPNPQPPPPPASHGSISSSGNSNSNNPYQYALPPQQQAPSYTQQPSASSSNPPQYDAPPYQSSYPGPPPGPPPGYLEYTESSDTNTLDLPVRSHDGSQVNASEDSAVRGHQFCEQYPLYHPAQYSQDQIQKARSGELGIQSPSEFRGALTRLAPNITKIVSYPDNQDAMLLSNLPVYSALYDRPVEKGKRTIYFEIKIVSLARSNPDSAISIGFAALPQPPWRMPGWHRGSLSVMSDDGRRFVNDSYGGRDFTQPFKVGETVGIGMRFQMGRAEVFHIRHGDECGSWWIDEEVDAEDMQYGGVTGLGGENDLYAAIGIFGDVEVDVIFHSQA